MNYMQKILSTKKTMWDVRSSNLEIIGLEIRRKRLELSITLQSLCYQVCSPSYLCKIERNQIQANNEILNELCKRLDIDEKQTRMLFHFHQILQQAVIAFVKKDVAKLKKYVDDGIGFENYRYRIIQYIYYIVTKDTYKAFDIYKELIRLLENMQDMDMMIFSLFTAVLFFMEKKYSEAIEILSSLDSKYLNDEANVVRLKYLFLASSMVLSVNTYFHYQEYKEMLYRLGYIDYLEESNYMLGLYGIKSNSILLYEQACNLLHVDLYKDTLVYLYSYKEKDFDKLKEMKDKKLRPFAEYLRTILDCNDATKELILHLSNKNDDYDFNTAILKYLCLNSIEEKRLFLIEHLSDKKEKVDLFQSALFLKEITRINIEKPHYKETVYLYYDYFKALSKD